MKKKLYQTGAIILSSIMVAGTVVSVPSATADAKQVSAECSLLKAKKNIVKAGSESTPVHIMDRADDIYSDDLKAVYTGKPVANHKRLDNDAFKVTVEGKTVTDFSIIKVDKKNDEDVYYISYPDYGYVTVSVPVITEKVEKKELDNIEISRFYGPKTLPEGYMPKATDFDVTATYRITDVTPDSPSFGNVSYTIEKVTDFTVSGKPAVGGKNTYTVTYQGKTADTNLYCMVAAKPTLSDKDIAVSYTGKELKDGTMPSRSDISVTAVYTATVDGKTTTLAPVTVKDFDISYLKDETVNTQKYNVYMISFTGTDEKKHSTSVRIPVNTEKKDNNPGFEEKMTFTGITASYKGGNVTVGSFPSKNDFDVKAIYTGSKGTKQTIKVTEFTISGSNSKAGRNKFTVTYNEKSADAYVTFVDKKASGFKTGDTELIDITASYKGKKVETGSAPSADDIKVTGKYRVYTDDNGHYMEYDRNVTGFTVSGRGDTAGDVKFTVTYCGKTTSLTIPYVKAAKDEIVSTKASVSARYHGRDLLTGTLPSKSDFIVTVTEADTYKDGSKKTKNITIPASGNDTFTISGASTAGTNIWTVSYKDMTASVPVTFYNASENNITSMTVKSLSAQYTGKTVQTGTWPERKDFSVKAEVEYTYRNGQKETKDITVPASGLDTFVLGGSVMTGVNSWIVSYGDETATVSVPFAHVKDKTSGSAIKKNTSGNGRTKKNTVVKKTSKKKKGKAKKASSRKKMQKNSRKTAKKSKNAVTKRSSKRARK